MSKLRHEDFDQPTEVSIANKVTEPGFKLRPSISRRGSPSPPCRVVSHGGAEGFLSCKLCLGTWCAREGRIHHEWGIWQRHIQEGAWKGESSGFSESRIGKLWVPVNWGYQPGLFTGSASLTVIGLWENYVKGGKKSQEKERKPSSLLRCAQYSLCARLCVGLGVPKGRPSPFSKELPQITGGQT